MKFKVTQDYKSTLAIDSQELEIKLIEGDSVEFDDPRVVEFIERDSPGTLTTKSKTGNAWLSGMANRQLVQAEERTENGSEDDPPAKSEGGTDDDPAKKSEDDPENDPDGKSEEKSEDEAEK